MLLILIEVLPLLSVGPKVVHPAPPELTLLPGFGLLEFAHWKDQLLSKRHPGCVLTKFCAVVEVMFGPPSPQFGRSDSSSQTILAATIFISLFLHICSSFWHVLEQPSPETAFPSSHCSP